MRYYTNEELVGVKLVEYEDYGKVFVSRIGMDEKKKRPYLTDAACQPYANTIKLRPKC